MFPEIEVDGCRTGVASPVLDTDLVGRNALGGVALTESDVRLFTERGGRLLIETSDSETLGLRGLDPRVKTGSCAVALLMDLTRSSNRSDVCDLPST